MRRRKLRRLKRARRRRRVHALTTALALTTATLAVVFYIFPAINGGSYDSREGTSNHTPKVSACALSDSPLNQLGEVQPARDLEEVVLVTEPAGEANPAELEQHEANLAGGMDNTEAMMQELQEQDAAMHTWYVEQAVANEKQRQYEDLVHRMRAYCIGHRFRQDLIDRVPMLIDQAQRTGNDPRLAVVTAFEESTGAQAKNPDGTTNIFGVLRWRSGAPGIDIQIQYYFNQITSYGYSGDVWHIAYTWYGHTAEGRAYADRVTRAVQRI